MFKPAVENISLYDVYKHYWEKRGGILVIDLVTCPITGRGGGQLLTAAHRTLVFDIDYRTDTISKAI